MPKIFRQKDIDQMEASDVTQEFVYYYNRLSEDKKTEFAENRPDLFSAVLSWEKGVTVTTSDGIGTYIEGNLDEDNHDNVKASISTDASFDKISNNIYDGIELTNFVKNDFQPVEALTIGNNQNRCPVHRTAFIVYNPTFHTPNRVSIGMFLYFCPECNRLFIKQSQYDINIKKLNECNIPHCFYDFELSKRYLKSQTKPYVLGRDEKIYVPDQWIEENPCCIIHECLLEELPCSIKYGSRVVFFDAYFCPECNKVILRRANALSIEDRCAEIGIPFAGFEALEKKLPQKKAIPKREIRPDYIIEDGTKSKCNFDNIANCYELMESDMVIVSDSIYCSIENHNTEEVLGLIWVKERLNGKRSSFLFALGYCADCEKYYMDEMDYKTLYNAGRPEVTILLDILDDSYMITSGEVFDFENKHLEMLENELKCEVDSIHNRSDYVRQYETISGYDDGDLAYRKKISKQKYEPRLTELHEYMGHPYQYRVDIASDEKSETYYIGSADIILDDKSYVISSNSNLGRELVHYKTIKIKKKGIEYGVKLSRQFDIRNATLYGYTNLRTDEDIIFRKGITDPFLVRVLNMRKKQHNLVDIFVTIQENQNAIVDADFRKNIIVQGCAGSGKTMVLLHRLSSLKYNRPDFDFSSDAIILTPNDNFTLHINGLAESLQIGSIEKISVERYYAKVLSEYSKNINPSSSLSSEMSVNQKFVDYIYSDDFRGMFNNAYSEIIEKRNNLILRLHEAEELMDEAIRDINISVDSEVIPQLSRATSFLLSKITKSEKGISEAEKSLKAIYGSKKNISIELPQKRKSLADSLRKLALDSKAKGLAAIAASQNSIDDKKSKLDEIIAEKDAIEKDVASFNFIEEIESFDNFKMRNAKWIDSYIIEKANLLAQRREKLRVKTGENTNLAEFLAVPVENYLKNETSKDPAFARILTKLSAEKNNLLNLTAGKEKLEKAWLAFGKAKKTTEFNDQIKISEELISTHKKSAVELYNLRRKQFETNREEIDKLDSDICEISNEIQSLVLKNMKKRLAGLRTRVTKELGQIRIADSMLEKNKGLIDSFDERMLDSEIFVWLNHISEFVPEVRDGIKIYNRQKNEVEQFEVAYSEIDGKIEAAQGFYDELLANRYSGEVKNTVESLNKELLLYSDYDTFKMVFEKAVFPFKEQNNIKSISGKYHRYDLYAQLIFAMKFYGKISNSKKFICVDEGQDLALNEYRLIQELNSSNVVFNIFGDTNQLIKPNRGIKEWALLEGLFETERYILNENYRNTNQITRFCNYSLGMSMLQTGVDGPKVREIVGREFEHELNNLKITTERVAILIPRKFQKKKYIESISAENESIGEEIDNGKIAIMYVDEVKGIEFDKVYVIPDNMTKEEKYIAYTRALMELIVVINELISIQEDDGTSVY